MIRLDLSDDQRREWQHVSRQAVGRVALRAQMVLLCARGYRVPRIAPIHNCGEDGVRLWCACGCTATARRGSPGWRMRRGRAPKDRLAAQSVDTQAGQAPDCSGHARSCWTGATLTAFLLSRLRLALARSSARR